MSITSVGSVQSYIYNAQTGKLSAKDGAADEFVSYFNGELAGEFSETLNGYDMEKKGGMETLIEMGLGHLGNTHNWIDSAVKEYEITCEIVNGEKSVYSVNGKEILVQCVPITYTRTELDTLGWAQSIPYKTYQPKNYDSATNSLNIAVGDTFDLRNGYKLTVVSDHIQVENDGTGSWKEGGMVQQLADGLNMLLHFADQQCVSDRILKEYMPMLLSLLQELGVDTEREFTINETTCMVEDGRIREVRNDSVLPGSVYRKAMQQYEEMLSKPLSHYRKA